MKKGKEIAIEGLKASPAIIGMLTFNPVAMVAGVLSLSAQAVEYIKSNIKDLTDDYSKNYKIPEMIDESLTSKHHIQFLREWILKVGYETREEKRQRYLNIAMNYPKKGFSFDKKLLFLNMLDRLSEDELHYFLKIYYPKVKSIADDEELNNLLIGHGLLEIDDRQLQESFKKIGTDIGTVREYLEKTKDSLSYGSAPTLSPFPEYNHLLDEPKINYKLTSLGREFYTFLQRGGEN